MVPPKSLLIGGTAMQLAAGLLGLSSTITKDNQGQAQCLQKNPHQPVKGSMGAHCS